MPDATDEPAPAAADAGGRRSILLVEDEAPLRTALGRFFRAKGYEVAEAGSGRAASEAFRAARPDVVVLDYLLPDADGLAVLREFHSLDASVPVLLLTGHGTIDLAVRAVKEGAEQFLAKPVEPSTLHLVVERLLAHQRHLHATLVERTREERQAVDPFLGESPAIRRLADQARRLVGSPSPVLVRGETGTGKGLLARWLHRHGPRSEEAFVDLNCAGLSRELLETELFGHEKGAFTGAVSPKRGLLEMAHRGTLFLDEVGDVDLHVQPKLLTVIEERRFRRLGEVRDRQVDLRFLAATHQDLERHVRERSFREDLFYRLSALPLWLPPLRERGSDVVLIARFLLRRIASDLGRPDCRLTGDAEQSLLRHPWPGNVRELRNLLERAVLLSDQAALSASSLQEASAASAGKPPAALVSLEEAERRHLLAVLAEVPSVPRAAEILGLSRSALYRKLQRHHLSPPGGEHP